MCLFWCVLLLLFLGDFVIPSILNFCNRFISFQQAAEDEQGGDRHGLLPLRQPHPVREQRQQEWAVQVLPYLIETHLTNPI